MSRYLGPKLRIIRRLGKLPGFTAKLTNREWVPGQHGPKMEEEKQQISAYSLRLREKQKLRYIYGVTEKQLYRYVKQARYLKGFTGVFLLQLLEMRLDNIVYKLGFTPTIASARQLITHCYIMLNTRILNIPSFQCKPNDVIAVKNSLNSNVFSRIQLELLNFKKLENHLELDEKKLIGKIKTIIPRNQIKIKINELLVIEFYSKK